MRLNIVALPFVAGLVLAACASSPTQSDDSNGETSVGSTTTELAERQKQHEPSTPEEPATTATSTTIASVADGVDISTQPGTEIGRASTGRAITNPVTWDTGTIYVDESKPEYFEFGFNPPDTDCVAAEVTATVGRGGAILLSLFIEGDHVPGTPCPEESGTNPLPLTLDEPLAGRRIYTDTTVYYGDATAASERMSDVVIGLELDEAVAMIDEAGFQSEVIPEDPGERESIFVADRINLYLSSDGTVEFASPG